MTKSIEEQAKKYAAMAYASPKEKVIAMIAYDHGANWAAKARDDQWQAVVNELRASLQYYKSNAMSFTHCQEVSPDVEEYCNGEIADDTLTKADQMLKEMGV